MVRSMKQPVMQQQIAIVLVLCGLFVLGACRPATTNTLPTRVRIDTATPAPTATTAPPTLAAVAAMPTATITDTPPPPPTFVPSTTAIASSPPDNPPAADARAVVVDVTATVTLPAPTAPVFPTVPLPANRIASSATTTSPPANQPAPPAAAQAAAPTPLPQAFRFGVSVDGNDLRAYRYGTGDKIVLLVGGIHAGFEANTVDLVTRLHEHFRDNPRDILPGITLIIVPSLNPDGLAYGRQVRGRFNGNNIDLNRNWGCGWSPNAVFDGGRVNPGSEPFSEPETRALGGLIQQVRPAAVLFYHAAANGIYSGNCAGAPNISDDLAAAVGEGTGYPYGASFDSYPLTGTASAWVNSIGIPAVAVELASSDRTEFSRNLLGVMDVQRWLIGQ